MAVRRDRGWELPERDATPPGLYLRRRDVLRAMGVATAALLVPGCGRSEESGAAEASPVRSPDGFATAEEATSFDAASTYNNFYEFGTGKGDPAENAASLVTRPWEVRVDGEVEKPGAIALEDLLRPHPVEERTYRLRCVEACSRVIPWRGI